MIMHHVSYALTENDSGHCSSWFQRDNAQAEYDRLKAEGAYSVELWTSGIPKAVGAEYAAYCETFDRAGYCDARR